MSECRMSDTVGVGEEREIASTNRQKKRLSREGGGGGGGGENQGK